MLLGYKKRKSLLWLYVAAGLLADLSLTYILKPNGYSGGWFANLYVAIEIVVITYYVSQKLTPRNKNIVYTLLCILLVGYTLHTLNKGIDVFNGTGMCIVFAFGICLCMFGLFSMLNQPANMRIVQLETSAFFWACVASIIYYTGNFLLFLFINYLEQADRPTLYMLWVLIHNNLNILHRGLLAVSLTRKNN